MILQLFEPPLPCLSDEDFALVTGSPVVIAQFASECANAAQFAPKNVKRMLQVFKAAATASFLVLYFHDAHQLSVFLE